MVVLMLLPTTGVAVADSTRPAAQAASIKGYVYADAGNDGYFDVDDVGVADIEIALDTGGVSIGVVRTDEAGQFAFENLRPGLYRLTEWQPANVGDGIDVAGTGGLVTGDDEVTVTLSAGLVSSGHLFAELPGTPGVSNPDFPILTGQGPTVVDPLVNDGTGTGPAGFDPTSLQLLDPDNGQSVTELTVTGEAHYRVARDKGVVEVTPAVGFVGWAEEIGYTVTSFDGRTSSSFIGVEVYQAPILPPSTGRQVLPP